MRIRSPAVSGMFYPADPATLRSMIQQYLQAVPSEEQQPFPKAIIAPHAGYVYSGPIAATVYQRVAAWRHRVKRVVLLGPSHRVSFRGIAAPTVDFFETPLGRVSIDQKTISQVRHEQFGFLDAAHQEEHSLEVQIPFLQEVLDDFVLIPLAVGDVSPDVVATVLETLWGGDETLIVISSDLSHFENYPTAQDKDQKTSDAIVRLDGQNLNGHQACGCRPIRGLLEVAKKKNMKARLLDLRNSGDTAGSKDRVVGYGAYSFSEPKPGIPSMYHSLLLKLAKRSVTHGVNHGRALSIELDDFPAILQAHRATFVTLYKNGNLRGCIGSLDGWRPLVQDLVDNAYAAAFHDPRFPVMKEHELHALTVKLSILTVPQPMNFDSEADLLEQIRPGIDGLILRYGSHRSTFLPSVWENLPNKQDFWHHLKRKANLKVSWWSNDAQISRYQSEYIE